MQATISSVNFKLSLEEIQLLLAEIEPILFKDEKTTPEVNIVLRRFAGIMTEALNKHKIINNITGYKLVARG